MQLTTENQAQKFFDRQTQIFGKETQQKILKTFVFLHRLNPINCEVGKNLALQGFSLIIFDDKKIEMEDFSNNLFINNDNSSKKGSKRSELIIPKLRELNPFIKVIEIEDLENNWHQISTCTFALFNPISQNEIILLQKNLQNFNGFVFMTFFKDSKAFTIVQKDKWADVEEKLKRISENTPQFILDFFLNIQENELDWNQELTLNFIFSGIFGAMLNQLILAAVVQNKLASEVFSFDCFGTPPDFYDTNQFQAF